MTETYLVFVGGVAVILFLIFRKRRAAAIIKQPRWGVANFLSAEEQSPIDEDISSLASILGTPTRRERDVPACDVLFIYARFRSDGTLENSTRGLRELIRDSGAVIVVVASENTGETYIAAAAKKPYGQANLVMTLKRNGEGFPRFFADLFSRMRAGISMPIAWVQLAPQHARSQGKDRPETMFACEVGQITFGNSEPDHPL
jgi:hypothetical protein